MATRYRKLGVLIGCAVLAVLISSSVGVSQFEFFTLTVTKAGPGSGTVTSSPAGINCGPTCTAIFREGTSVTLTATPDAGSTVQSWSGCDSFSGNQCTVIMNRTRTVTVTFSVATFTLSVTKSGAGSGTVTSSPSGINCGTVCSASFSAGTVTLTATPSPGSLIDSWSGCDSVSADKKTCTVSGTAGASKTVSVSFSVGCTLTVTKAGTGSGTVTSTPAGINCGADCSETYVCGTTVTLTAAADSGSTFRGWSGACSGRGTCSVTMDANKSVTATFRARPTPAPLGGCEGTSQNDIIQTCEDVVIRGDGNGVSDDGPNACSSSRCGNDLIIGSDDDDQIYGDDSFGGWRMSGRDVIYGGKGDDTIYGESGDDTIYGEDDDDVIDGGNGNDRLQGDKGNDRLQGGPGRDVLLGGLDNDELYGGSGNDILRGNDGIDTIDGGTGNDMIEGGLGSDFLVGGGGNDTFIVRAGDAGDDTETIICTQAHNEKGRIVFIGEFPDLLLGRFRNTILTVQDDAGSFEIITGPGVCVISRR